MYFEFCFLYLYFITPAPVRIGGGAWYKNIWILNFVFYICISLLLPLCGSEVELDTIKPPILEKFPQPPVGKQKWTNKNQAGKLWSECYSTHSWVKSKKFQMRLISDQETMWGIPKRWFQRCRMFLLRRKSKTFQIFWDIFVKNLKSLTPRTIGGQPLMNILSEINFLRF